jgi:hypothetical protein
LMQRIPKLTLNQAVEEHLIYQEQLL